MTHALREHAHGKRIIGARRTRPARASYIRRGIPVLSSTTTFSRSTADGHESPLLWTPLG